VCNGSTVEGRLRGDPPSRITIPKGDPFLPFPLTDPWGFRRAIVPVFRQDAEGIVAVGSAFHIGGRGRFLTANHNVGRQKYTSADIGETPVNDPFAPRIMLLLPFGLVYGTTKLPEHSMVTVTRLGNPLVEIDDPIESLKGADPMGALDIATIEADISVDVPIETLPLRLKGAVPILGEPVLALGYPSISAEMHLPGKSIVTLSEEMQGAFGRITGHFPWGRGRRNPTPVYQVEGNWAPGMSGGPVLNQAGEVIGVVSQSLLSDDIGTRNGIGYASAFAFMTNVTESMQL
jgi:serine protease Do